MLADSVFREPLTFQVIPFDDRKICYTFVVSFAVCSREMIICFCYNGSKTLLMYFFQSRDLDTKHVWLLELKKRLLDSYAAAVPMKVYLKF
jgi:hypothetical protein